MAGPWGVVSRLYDGFANFVTGLGTAKDPTRGGEWTFNPLGRYEQDKIYRTNWIGRAIVDAPAEDCSREWRSWQASRQQIAAIEAVEKQFNIREKFKQAVIRGRLYGGGGIMLGVAQGRPTDPLDLDKVGLGDLKFAIVLNRYELAAGPRIYDVLSPWYGRPSFYTLATPVSNVAMTQPGVTVKVSPPGLPDAALLTQMDPDMAWVHPSRVIEFTGNALPDWRLAVMGGVWGDSVLQTCEEELRDAVMALGSAATMLSDAKMDVIKIPDMTENIVSKEYEAQLVKRFMAANRAKSTVNALILDIAEEWQRVQTDFGGIPPLLQYLTTVACGAGGVPMSRVMGSAPTSSLSAKGSSGGEIDVRNYYDRCATRQETEYRPAMAPLDRCIVQSALGRPMPLITYKWNSLYKPDPKEKADTDLVVAQTLQTYISMGNINPEVWREVVANTIIENEVAPGFEDAAAKYGLEPPEPELPDAWTPTVDPKTGKPLPAGAGLGGPQKALPKPGDDPARDD